nr:LysE family translocator [Desulfotalea psychrophila]
MMIPLDVALTFLFASVVLALVPGPDNIFVLTQSALHGRRSGIAVVFGLCTGVIFHSCAVALGVAVIFQTSALAFTVLKFLGAAYLAYLAWLSFRTKGSPLVAGEGLEQDRWKLYRRGILMSITNPKVSIFFLAFLPQFADPARGPVSLAVLLLGALFMCSTVVIFGLIALLAGSLGEYLHRSKNVQVWLHKIAGTVYLGLAVKLALLER